MEEVEPKMIKKSDLENNPIREKNIFKKLPTVNRSPKKQNADLSEERVIDPVSAKRSPNDTLGGRSPGGTSFGHDKHTVFERSGSLPTDVKLKVFTV